MPLIELIYDPECPNVPKAREQLLEAFAMLALPPRWQEWRTDDPKMPDHAQGYGSPTILVDGQDLSGSGEIDGTAGCRVYATAEGLSGVPTVEEIVACIRSSLGSSVGR